MFEKQPDEKPEEEQSTFASKLLFLFFFSNSNDRTLQISHILFRSAEDILLN